MYISGTEVGWVLYINTGKQRRTTGSFASLLGRGSCDLLSSLLVGRRSNIEGHVRGLTASSKSENSCKKMGIVKEISS